MDLGTIFVKCIKYKHISSNIGRKLHLKMAPVSLPPISLVYEAYFLLLQGPKGAFVFSLLIFNFVFIGAKKVFGPKKCLVNYFSFNLKKQSGMSPHLAMALQIVIRLVTVSVSYLTLHQEFYLIEIYHVGANCNVLRKLDLQLHGSRLCKVRFLLVQKRLYFKVCFL